MAPGPPPVGSDIDGGLGAAFPPPPPLFPHPQPGSGRPSGPTGHGASKPGTKSQVKLSYGLLDHQFLNIKKNPGHICLGQTKVLYPISTGVPKQDETRKCPSNKESSSCIFGPNPISVGHLEVPPFPARRCPPSCPVCHARPGEIHVRGLKAIKSAFFNFQLINFFVFFKVFPSSHRRSDDAW